MGRDVVVVVWLGFLAAEGLGQLRSKNKQCDKRREFGRMRWLYMAFRPVKATGMLFEFIHQKQIREIGGVEWLKQNLDRGSAL